MGSRQPPLLLGDGDRQGIEGVIISPFFLAAVQLGNCIDIDSCFLKYESAQLSLTAAGDRDNFGATVRALRHRRIRFAFQQEGKLRFGRTFTLHDLSDDRRVNGYWRNIGVDNIQAVIGSGEAVQRRFFNGISDFIALRVILGHSKAVTPLAVVVRGDLLLLCKQAVLHEPDRDGLRQHAFVVTAQLPRLFTLDFHLYPVFFKGVGNDNLHRLTGKGDAIAVCDRLAVPFGIIVVLPDFILYPGWNFKFPGLAGFECKFHIRTVNDNGKAELSVFVRLRVFARQPLGNAEDRDFLRLIRCPVLEPDSSIASASDDTGNLHYTGQISAGAGFFNGVGRAARDLLEHGGLTML